MIDVQHHILPPDYVAALGKDRIADALVSGTCPDWTPQASLDAMGSNGIDCSILSLSAPGFHFDDAANAAALAALCNDYAAQTCADAPKHFQFFAMLPLPHTDACLEEIERMARAPGCRGMCLLTNAGGVYLGDPATLAVLEEIDRRGLVAFVHPADLSGGRPIPHIPAATLEFPFDTTRAITNLLFTGTMHRLRNIKFIFSHAGGTIPFLIDRIGRLQRRPDLAQHVPDGALAEVTRHYYDVALSAGKRTLAPLLDTVPASHVLFASDFPFAGEDTMAATVKALGNQGLDAATVTAISRGNAEALFQL